VALFCKLLRKHLLDPPTPFSKESETVGEDHHAEWGCETIKGGYVPLARAIKFVGEKKGLVENTRSQAFKMPN